MQIQKPFAQAIVEILEAEGVEYVFGHPGEQILPVYEALRKSSITHILMRHEQGAAHAADAYARESGNFGVCIASAGPGALNLTMGIATAYKDSVPILTITGDVSTKLKGGNVFQEVDTTTVFAPITICSRNIHEPVSGIIKLKEAIETLKHGKKGPVHLSIPSDVLNQELDSYLIHQPVSITFKNNTLDLKHKIKTANQLIQNAKKPLIIAGAGIIWSKSADKLIRFAKKYKIPVSTTYHARGVFPVQDPLYLGMIGIRGTEASKYAGRNADVIIAVGTRLSERTTTGVGESKIIQVDLNEKNLKGDINLEMDVATFMDSLINLKTTNFKNWLDELEKYSTEYDIDTDFDDVPIKPQRAVKEILGASGDSIIVTDAGAYTTWVTLLQHVKEPGLSVFSGGFGPMGYALPASVGVSLAKPQKTVVVLVGDGGFQMTSQELATVKQLNLPVLICILNNNSLGIIKQWQNRYYGEIYEVELQNPDFVKLAESYGIDSIRINTPGEIQSIVNEALKFKKPYLIEFIIDKDEEIPLP